MTGSGKGQSPEQGLYDAPTGDVNKVRSPDLGRKSAGSRVSSAHSAAMSGAVPKLEFGVPVTPHIDRR